MKSQEDEIQLEQDEMEIKITITKRMKMGDNIKSNGMMEMMIIKIKMKRK